MMCIFKMSDLIRNLKIFENDFFSDKAYLEDFNTRIFHLEYKILLEYKERITMFQFIQIGIDNDSLDWKNERCPLMGKC